MKVHDNIQYSIYCNKVEALQGYSSHLQKQIMLGGSLPKVVKLEYCTTIKNEHIYKHLLYVTSACVNVCI